MLRQERVDARRALDGAPVPGVGDLHVARTGDRVGQRAPDPGKGNAVVGGRHDQRRNAGERAEGGADQKVGSESRRRLDDLLAEMKAIEGALLKGGAK